MNNKDNDAMTPQIQTLYSLFTGTDPRRGAYD